MATHSSILAWEIPSEEPGGPQSMGSQESVSTEYTRHLRDKEIMFSLLNFISAVLKIPLQNPNIKNIYFLKHCNSHALRHFWLEIAGTAISQIPGILLCTVLLLQLKSID